MKVQTPPDERFAQLEGDDFALHCSEVEDAVGTPIRIHLRTGMLQIVTPGEYIVNHEDESTLLWNSPSQPLSRLKRICRLPEPNSSGVGSKGST